MQHLCKAQVSLCSTGREEGITQMKGHWLAQVLSSLQNASGALQHMQEWQVATVRL